MGPFELMDLIGHDVNFAVTRSLFDGFYCDRRYLPSPLQAELVRAGWLGRKSGRGFYRYDPNGPKPQPVTHPPQKPPAAATIEGTLGPAESLVGAMKTAGIAVTRRGGCGLIRLPGATLGLTDGRTATTRAAEGAPGDLVLFDLAFDYATASRIGLAKAHQAPLTALDCAAGLFQALGKSASAIDDTPGMLVMRTVAMLANEAAEVIMQGIASAEDVDQAMLFGVNYPAGPVAWAGKVGAPVILQVLDNLQKMYGDDRYRPCISWRRVVALARNASSLRAEYT
jgi:3-hydroxybutyryl-CoA dehydrogenase